MKVVGNPERVVVQPGAAELAAADSAPLADIVERILDVSDNEAAEVLGHHVGIAVTGEGSFEAGAAGVLETLRGLGIDVSTAELYDGSGLSRRNRVTTSLVLRAAAARGRPGRGADAQPDHRPAGGRVHRVAHLPLRRRPARGARAGARQDRDAERGAAARRHGRRSGRQRRWCSWSRPTRRHATTRSTPRRPSTGWPPTSPPVDARRPSSADRPHSSSPARVGA